tara:strand:- start:252 stop:449 length:198 start_codon:yes stop_codon:yes gene_type:complete
VSNNNNSNEFDLSNRNQKLQETPYRSLEKVGPKGYLNPLQMPFINDEQRRELKKSLEELGRGEDV